MALRGRLDAARRRRRRRDRRARLARLSTSPCARAARQIDDALGRQAGARGAGRAGARDAPGCATRRALPAARAAAARRRLGSATSSSLDADGQRPPGGDDALPGIPVTRGDERSPRGKARRRATTAYRQRPRARQHGAARRAAARPVRALARRASTASLVAPALAAARSCAWPVPRWPRRSAALFARRVIRRSPTSPRRPSTSTATGDLARRVDAARRRRARAHRRALQRDARPLEALGRARSAGWSPTPRTSCARRSPACARTSRCCCAGAGPAGAGERGALLERRREQTEELSDLIADVDRARRAARRRSPAPRTSGSTSSRRRRRARRPPRARRALRAATRSRAWSRALPDRLARAVGNLLDNAAKYGPPGGVVDVRCAAARSRCATTGPGVPGAEAPFVFDRFYRGDRRPRPPGLRPRAGDRAPGRRVPRRRRRRRGSARRRRAVPPAAAG